MKFSLPFAHCVHDALGRKVVRPARNVDGGCDRDFAFWGTREVRVFVDPNERKRRLVWRYPQIVAWLTDIDALAMTTLVSVSDDVIRERCFEWSGLQNSGHGPSKKNKGAHRQ
jgi:hypothetical protein